MEAYETITTHRLEDNRMLLRLSCTGETIEDFINCLRTQVGNAPLRKDSLLPS